MAMGDYNPCNTCGIRNCNYCMSKYYYMPNFTYNPPVKIIEKFDDKGNLIERITEPYYGI